MHKKARFTSQKPMVSPSGESGTSGKRKKSSTRLDWEISQKVLKVTFNTLIIAPSPRQNPKPFESGGGKVLVPSDPMMTQTYESQMPPEEKKNTSCATSHKKDGRLQNERCYQKSLKKSIGQDASETSKSPRWPKKVIVAPVCRGKKQLII
jgi:hypothetical protein